MARFCTVCGRQAGEADQVCQGCGCKLPKPNPATPPAQPPYGGAPNPAPRPTYGGAAPQPGYGSAPNPAPYSPPPGYGGAPNPAPYSPPPSYGSAPNPAPYSPPPTYGGNPAVAAATPPGHARPVGQLKTNRAMWKYFLFSVITLGIYGLIVMSSVSSDINTIAGRYDGRKTMHYCLVFFIFSWLTFGIVPLVWYTKISSRIGGELKRRGIDYSFGGGQFWLFGILLSCVVFGPFVYYHKLFKSMNLLSEHYNIYG